MAKRSSGNKRTAAGTALTELIFMIFRANGRLLRAGDHLGRDLGLTAARWQVMGAIDRGDKTVAQIAREFELSRQGVLWVVNALNKEGIVELAHNPDHRRAKLVRFTKRGREVCDEMNARQIAWINEVGDHFDATAIESAVQIISQVTLRTVNESED
ncbi:transcriptional regulator, MarR family [Sphingobium sp. AP50]|uniref:MarR family winged helix-turn-helix transcriptional regulator n=1 Tax=Sphingobium sp. AP50 TaxID=1884369 RepID=UPI0008AE9815|nr:MarR family transcriptional regulator [Sphingobium sp. AP50]SEK00334.1 transcriptional regulator, MarR family [Sphingobium sp. AP50]